MAHILPLLPLPDDFSRLFKFAEERVHIRAKTGSTSHDLFYHFVRLASAYKRRIEIEHRQNLGPRNQESDTSLHLRTLLTMHYLL